MVFPRLLLPGKRIVAGSEFEGIGIVNWQNEILVPFEYQKIETLADNYLQIRKNYFFGIMNLQGQLLVPPEYDYVEYARPDKFIVHKGDLEGLVNANHQFLLSLTYQDLNSVENCIIAKRNGKYGVYDKSINTLIPIEYESAEFYSREDIVLTKGSDQIIINIKDLNVHSYPVAGESNFGPPEVEDVAVSPERETIDGKAFTLLERAWGLRLIEIDRKMAILDRNNKMILPLDVYHSLKNN